MKTSISGFILLLISVAAIAQPTPVNKLNNKSDASKILDFRVSYTYQQPDGDLATRYGNLHHIGAAVFIKSKKNWCAEAEVGYQFGTNVKEPGLFYYLSNSSGYVMNNSGYPANYSLGERGFNLTFSVGKLLPLSANNRNSGILIMVGGGYYMHKINIANRSNDIPTLTTEYKKGYDRLTAGYGVSEFVGYMFHSQNRFVNFYIGFDFSQAFTQSVRGYNYDQMLPDTKKRLDMTNGIRFGWLIPVYLSSRDEDEFDFR